ncbi:MAG: alkylhydroperoxidase-related (seleno)protein [Pseudomonadota bacterium]
MSFAYADSPYSIPDYKIAAHRACWDYLARPGSWWSGAERIAIAQASRDAIDCPLCAERKAALSPESVNGVHAGESDLPEAIVDAVHRITTDPARLTERWVKSKLSDSFTEGHYIEAVSIITCVISIDTLHRALGLPLEPLPVPEPGEPDAYRPAGAALDVAWLPMIYPENLTDREADIYFGAPQMGHVIRAMSLVPEAVRQLNALSTAHYLPTPEVGDMGADGLLSLSRMQTELVAARTSIKNDCFY